MRSLWVVKLASVGATRTALYKALTASVAGGTDAMSAHKAVVLALTHRYDVLLDTRLEAALVARSSRCAVSR